MSFTVKVCNLHHNSRVQIVHFHTYTEAVGCTRFPKYQISLKKYSYNSILVYVEPPSKTNHLGVHNLLWKYAIYNMNAPYRLHTFTVNYVHQCGWFCSVAPNIWMKRQNRLLLLCEWVNASPLHWKSNLSKQTRRFNVVCEWNKKIIIRSTYEPRTVCIKTVLEMTMW